MRLPKIESGGDYCCTFPYTSASGEGTPCRGDSVPTITNCRITNRIQYYALKTVELHFYLRRNRSRIHNNFLLHDLSQRCTRQDS